MVKSSFATKNCLGIYKTKERALEILNEIQETICLDEFNYENEENRISRLL